MEEKAIDSPCPNSVQRFSIFIKGEPITKSNSTFFGGKKRVYIPQRFIDYEKAINDEVKEFLSKYPTVATPLFPTGPVKVTLIYYLGTKRKKDLPNLPKTTCDALSNIVYTDDCQICDMVLKKYYSKNQPGVEIIVEAMETPAGVEYPLPRSVIIPDVKIKPIRAKKSKSKAVKSVRATKRRKK